MVILGIVIALVSKKITILQGISTYYEKVTPKI